jgi:hypothetical protein
MTIPALFLQNTIGTQYLLADQECSASKSTSYPNAEASLQNLLQDEPNASILLFGYTHRGSDNAASGANTFSEEILPQLAKQGFVNLVLELFPAGLDDAPLAKELTAFNQTGIIGPEMEKQLPIYDRENFIKLLTLAFINGIKIHAGGNNEGSNDFKELRWRQIADNSEKAIRKLAAGKVAWFGGSSHNDLSPKPKNAQISFGWKLANSFGTRVVEIEVVIPELAKAQCEKSPCYQALPLPQNCDWEKYIPTRGNTLVKTAPQTYLMVSPE